MDWEESWTNFKRSYPQVQTYGEKIGRHLVDLDERYPGQSVAWRAENNYKALLEHFDGNVPEWIQNDFIQGLNFDKDYILENLQTHNWRGMWEDIKRTFGKSHVVGDMEDLTGKGYLVWYLGTNFSNILKDKNSQERKDLDRIVEFYGYFISQVKSGKVVLEARYPKNAYEYVHKECGGWGYTAVPKANVPGVDKAGLRCKSGNDRELEKEKEAAKSRGEDPNHVKMYREFPQRIYFAAFPEERDWKWEMGEILDEIGRDWDSVDIYRINFNKLHFPIYQDPAMDSNAFFVYNNIPLSCLQKVHES